MAFKVKVEVKVSYSFRTFKFNLHTHIKCFPFSSFYHFFPPFFRLPQPTSKLIPTRCPHSPQPLFLARTLLILIYIDCYLGGHGCNIVHIDDQVDTIQICITINKFMGKGWLITTAASNVSVRHITCKFPQHFAFSLSQLQYSTSWSHLNSIYKEHINSKVKE